MITDLDLGDIQGNIVKAYGRYGFPVARHIFFHIRRPVAGRKFVTKLTPFITTSIPWTDVTQAPPIATNIGFTYEGLKSLDVPEETLHGFPDEFSMGMKARRDIVGDTGPNHFRNWDPIWISRNEEQHVHIIVSLNGRNEDYLDKRYQEILDIAALIPDVILLSGHRGEQGDDLPYQSAAVVADGKEHFGFSDGISNSYFEGCGEDPKLVIGGGKPTGLDPRTFEGWKPLKAGEFVLGHVDESGTYPEAPGPPLFSRNGTYMVYRKLHQNVGSFNQLLDEQGALFPDGKEAFAAKLAGRWRNGAPLALFPTEDSANRFDNEIQALRVKSRSNTATPQEKARYAELQLQLVAFDYGEDKEGAKCPFGSHTRRVNPRSALQFESKNPFDTPGALSNRRRMLRRGLTYGRVTDPTRDDGDHGVIIMLLNAGIGRQFEFVQQQWINFGNDFRLANDQDPILGNHGINEKCHGNGRMMIEGDREKNKPPYFCGRMPTLIETRGGDYFFVPSMTCLRMIGLGIIDPT